MRCILH